MMTTHTFHLQEIYKKWFFWMNCIYVIYIYTSPIQPIAVLPHPSRWNQKKWCLDYLNGGQYSAANQNTDHLHFSLKSTLKKTVRLTLRDKEIYYRQTSGEKNRVYRGFKDVVWMDPHFSYAAAAGRRQCPLPPVVPLAACRAKQNHPLACIH